MKMVKDKKVLVGADFAGVPLKNAVVAHLEKNGWEVTDIGVKSVDEENPEIPPHRPKGRSKNRGGRIRKGPDFLRHRHGDPYRRQQVPACSLRGV